MRNHLAMSLVMMPGETIGLKNDFEESPSGHQKMTICLTKSQHTDSEKSFFFTIHMRHSHYYEKLDPKCQSLLHQARFCHNKGKW